MLYLVAEILQNIHLQIPKLVFSIQKFLCTLSYGGFIIHFNTMFQQKQNNKKPTPNILSGLKAALRNGWLFYILATDV